MTDPRILSDTAISELLDRVRREFPGTAEALELHISAQSTRLRALEAREALAEKQIEDLLAKYRDAVEEFMDVLSDRDSNAKQQDAALRRVNAASAEITTAFVRASSSQRDTERLDWLESESRREGEHLQELGQFPPSLFRRNLPITRKAIDENMRVWAARPTTPEETPRSS